MMWGINSFADVSHVAVTQPNIIASQENEFSFILELTFAPQQTDIMGIAPEEQADLALLAHQLSRFTRLNQVQITAYANDTNDASRNLALAQQRAHTIKTHLVARGVIDEMVLTQAVVDSGLQPSGRVEIEIYGRTVR